MSETGTKHLEEALCHLGAVERLLPSLKVDDLDFISDDLKKSWLSVGPEITSTIGYLKMQVKLRSEGVLIGESTPLPSAPATEHITSGKPSESFDEQHPMIQEVYTVIRAVIGRLKVVETTFDTRLQRLLLLLIRNKLAERGLDLSQLGIPATDEATGEEISEDLLKDIIKEFLKNEPSGEGDTTETVREDETSPPGSREEPTTDTSLDPLRSGSLGIQSSVLKQAEKVIELSKKYKANVDDESEPLDSCHEEIKTLYHFHDVIVQILRNMKSRYPYDLKRVKKVHELLFKYNEELKSKDNLPAKVKDHGDVLSTLMAEIEASIGIIKSIDKAGKFKEGRKQVVLSKKNSQNLELFSFMLSEIEAGFGLGAGTRKYRSRKIDELGERLLTEHGTDSAVQMSKKD